MALLYSLIPKFIIWTIIAELTIKIGLLERTLLTFSTLYPENIVLGALFALFFNKVKVFRVEAFNTFLVIPK